MTMKRHRAYLKWAEQQGLVVVGISTTGNNHQRLTLTARGREKTFIIPTSASDNRAFMNWKGDVKRWLREVENDG